MNWIDTILNLHSPLQSVILVSMITAAGMALAKIKLSGVSLGVAWVFFVGIVAGHFGLSIDDTVLRYTETLGLVLFVYTLGLHVGPNFFGSLRHEGVALNAWSIAVILLGTAMAVAITLLTPMPVGDVVGILCGATTNTPALGAAQQALEQIGASGERAALATAVTYPFGVVGVIIAIIVLRRFFVRPDDLKPKTPDETNHTHIDQYVVVNPAIMGKSIAEVSQMAHLKFIVSRIWRGSQVIVPLATTRMEKDDTLMVVANPADVSTLEILFGRRLEKDWNQDRIDWNHLDSKVESRILVITRRVLNGKRLGQLQLRKAYGVNVSRVMRGDITLLATDDLRLQYGDRVTVVGTHDDIDHTEHFFGNTVKTLSEPNIGSIFLGMMLGLLLGTLPIPLPFTDHPLRLGIAGGPIIMGIIVGALGPRMHFISYTTRSASLMLRKMGLSLYLACLGLDAGKDLIGTVMRPEGLLWLAIGIAVTLLPVVIVGLVALLTRKMDFGTICGLLCGSMANPMALSYATDTIPTDKASLAYATVYPIGMFLRVIIAQMLVVMLV
ncbi:MAG: putative transporter [Prevotella sp.]|nr:putative transporter [Prevotella sp.]